jgi:hypothetical protein
MSKHTWRTYGICIQDHCDTKHAEPPQMYVSAELTSAKPLQVTVTAQDANGRQLAAGSTTVTP